MICRLILFAVMIVKLLMSKVYGIIGILEIEFFSFSDTESVKKYR